MAIFDNSGMIADGLAYGGTPTAIDLGMVKPGPGRPIKLWIQGNGSLAGATGITVTDGDAVAAADALLSITASAAEINAGLQVELPSHVRRYVKAALAGTATAGAWTCGVILDSGQLNP